MTNVSTGANRALTRLLAVGVLLFATMVAAGTYLRTGSLVPGAIVLGSAILFLGLWYSAGHRLANRQSGGATDLAAHEGSTRTICTAAFLLSVVAWGLAIAGDLFTMTSVRGALLLLTAMAGTCLAAFLAAVIGLSYPAQRSGKVLGILALVAVAALVLFVVIRTIVGF